jgi:hypothetical protein
MFSPRAKKGVIFRSRTHASFAKRPQGIFDRATKSQNHPRTEYNI